MAEIELKMMRRKKSIGSKMKGDNLKPTRRKIKKTNRFGSNLKPLKSASIQSHARKLIK